MQLREQDRRRRRSSQGRPRPKGRSARERGDGGDLPSGRGAGRRRDRCRWRRQRGYRTGHDGHRRHGPLPRARPHRRPHPHRVLQAVDHDVRRCRRPLRDDERYLGPRPDLCRRRARRRPGRPFGGRGQPDEDLLGRALQGAVHDPRDERRLPPRPRGPRDSPAVGGLLRRLGDGDRVHHQPRPRGARGDRDGRAQPPARLRLRAHGERGDDRYACGGRHPFGPRELQRRRGPREDARRNVRDGARVGCGALHGGEHPGRHAVSGPTRAASASAPTT